MAGGIPVGIPINIPLQPGAMPMGGGVPPDVMQSIMSALGGMGAVPGAPQGNMTMRKWFD